jgi:hypothetical protein
MACPSFKPEHVPTPEAVRDRIEYHRNLIRQLRALLAFSRSVHSDAGRLQQPKQEACRAR